MAQFTNTWLKRAVSQLGIAVLVLGGTVDAAAKTETAPPAPQSTSSVTKKKPSGKRRRSRRPRGQRAPTPERIREIQSALAREGVYTGTPTGKWDAASMQAMRKFQAAQGLNPTGKLDALSLQKLGLGSEVAGRAAPRAPLTTQSVPVDQP